VVKLYLDKIDGVVAPIADTAHLPSVWVLVTGRALALSPLVHPLVVTALAVCRGVGAFQGKGMLIQHASGKSDGAWCDRGAWGGRDWCLRQRLCGLKGGRGRCPSRPCDPHHGPQTEADDQEQDQKRAYPTIASSFHV
jgi:hypothetical protein